jgi:hypothetical protein
MVILDVREIKGFEFKKGLFPINRQFQIVASSIVFLEFIGAKLIVPEFIYLALLVGFGLALSDYVGIFPMVNLLHNQSKRSKTINEKSADCCQELNCRVHK